jgi:hypothetical protein
MSINLHFIRHYDLKNMIIIRRLTRGMEAVVSADVL